MFSGVFPHGVSRNPHGDSRRLPAPGFWRAFIAVLAIAIILVGTTAMVAHGHASGQNMHDGCSLCVSTHVVVAIVLTITLTLAQRSAPMRPREVLLPARHTLECACWNRPPPVQTCSLSESA